MSFDLGGSKRKERNPLLSTELLKPTQEGYCGNFERRRKWKVEDPQKGIIVQHVTRKFNVKKTSDNSDLSGGALEAYVKNPRSFPYSDIEEYWELWTVDENGTVSDTGIDTFGMCSLIEWDGKGKLDVAKHIKGTTKGSFVIKGVAHFYATDLAPTNFGFTKNNKNVEVAGGIYSKSSAPNIGVSTTSEENFKVTVRWDSTDGADEDGKIWSNVIEE